MSEQKDVGGGRSVGSWGPRELGPGTDLVADSLEKTLMLGGIGGRRRRG